MVTQQQWGNQNCNITHTCWLWMPFSWKVMTYISQTTWYISMIMVYYLWYNSYTMFCWDTLSPLCHFISSGAQGSMYCKAIIPIINSLAPGNCGSNLRLSILKFIPRIDILRFFLWNCPHVNAKRPHLWLVNNVSGNGLMLSGIKPLPEPMLTHVYLAIWHHQTTMCKMHHINVLFYYHDSSWSIKYCCDTVFWTHAYTIYLTPLSYSEIAASSHAKERLSLCLGMSWHLTVQGHQLGQCCLQCHVRYVSFQVSPAINYLCKFTTL